MQTDFWGNLWFHAWFKHKLRYVNSDHYFVFSGLLISMQIWFKFTAMTFAGGFLKQQMILSVINFLTGWVAQLGTLSRTYYNMRSLTECET